MHATLVLKCFILLGISCPRAPRDDAAHSDQFGQQALMYTKELIFQREVCIDYPFCLFRRPASFKSTAKGVINPRRA